MADVATVEVVEMQPWVPADTFAARLALIRQHLGGWNVKKTANFCGIDDQSWRNWESGVSRPRNFEDVCRRIAAATGVDRRWLQAGGPLISRCFAGWPNGPVPLADYVGQRELALQWGEPWMPRSA